MTFAVFSDSLTTFPEIENYDIENPYKDHPIDDDDIKALVSYLENNKFPRIRPPVGSFKGAESIFIDLKPPSEPCFINLCYTVYYPKFSFLKYNSKYYRLNKDDREFLHELFFGDDK
jgi:hypothetical protein